VPDVPNWREYRNRVQLRGRAAGGSHLTLIESVRQDRARRLTTFEQRYVERRRGRTTEHRFALTFRTLTIAQMTRRLEAAGFAIDAVLGDYRGRPWDERACAIDLPAISGPNVTFSRTVRHGNNKSRCIM